ncbi:hypothetical protein ACFWUW_02145 [Streptomyces sp. NPDC058655]|uniref:hypothetical protein n=1 Tax=Streptomyces sp. NPDC058655 TaxID=3346577 RepID=UPI00366633F1
MRKGSRAVALLTLCCCTSAVGLTGCGGPAPDGYVAVGPAAPGPERGAGEKVAPQGPVEFQQLGGPATAAGAVSSRTPPDAAQARPTGGSARGGAMSTAPGGAAAAPGSAPGPGRAATPSGSSGAPGGRPGSATSATPPSGAPGGPGTPGAPATPPGTGPGTKPGTTPPAPPPPATPARLTLSTPARTSAADRWCERVTVTFTNTGTTAARSGTVSFATHIIGALGVDWATITTTQPLPGPLAGGAAKTHTFTVCVQAWRVPLGMHVETRNVTASWS